MKVKELKEILNTLPDEAEVIVSEKISRGGNIQRCKIGIIHKDCGDYWIEENEKFSLVRDLSFYKKQKERYEKELEEINKNNIELKDIKYETDSRQWKCWQTKEGVVILHWIKNFDKEISKKDLIKLVKNNIESYKNNIENCEKKLKNIKEEKITGIELSCAF